LPARALRGGKVAIERGGSRAASLGAVALLEFFQAAAWARVIAANIFQRVAHRRFMGVAAVWAMHVALVVGMLMVVSVVVLAIWAVDVGFLLHGVYSGM
jgi:hypothetical protein